MDPEHRRAGRDPRRPRVPARRLHHAARHVLPPRGGPPRCRGCREAGTSSARCSSTAPDPTAWPGPSASPTCAPGRACSTRSGPRRPRRRHAARHLHLLPRGLTEVVETLRKVLTETSRPGVLTTHVSETPPRTPASASATTPPPPSCSRAPGWLEPDLPSVLGHGVHLTATDRELVAAGGCRDRPLPRVEPEAGERGPALGGGAGSGIRLGRRVPTAAPAPTTSTCGRRCARPPCSPG